MKNQSKKPVKKKPAKKPVEKNSRIKESGGVHWVLHKQHDVRKYKGFKNKTEAEIFAAATPIEKGIKITAEKAKPERVKKVKKTPPKKSYQAPRLEAVGSERSPKSKDGKVMSFRAGRAKYGKK